MRSRWIFFFTGLWILTSCAPQFKKPERMTVQPRLADTAFISFDGTELPLKTWMPAGLPEAVFIGLHGFNDYANFIRDCSSWFNNRGIGIYAYDQRGFGQTANRGRWSGREAMYRDLRTIIALVRIRHPDVPLYLLGDSMGGAVIMAAEQADDPLDCDGVILVAPAVWSRDTMPFYQRWALWLGARTMPWLKLTGEPLGITPSDNEEMLKALGRDPLVIKKTRVEAIYGLTNLMDAAYAASSTFDRNALFLYGARDEIIPPKPMAHVFGNRISGGFSKPQRLLVYPNGYHMLLRDLQGEVVWQDILFWLQSPAGTFPSVEGQAAREVTNEADIRRYIFPDADNNSN